jgi:mRNA interferase MazF
MWVAMVTSAENPAWPGDVEIGPGFADMGLPIPSRIRPVKIATIDTAQAEPIGRIGNATLRQVELTLRHSLGIP